MKRSVPVEILRDAFDYNPESGHLTWIGINRKMLGKRAGCSSGRYRKVCIKGVRVFEHRAIWALVYGHWPELEIDHRNRDGHDNRLVNLRECDRSSNCANRSVFKSNSLGVRGVTKTRSGKYHARVQVKGFRKTVGTFRTISEAKEAISLAEANMREVF